MSKSRLIHFLFVISFMLTWMESGAQSFKQGFWIGYSHGTLTPVTSNLNFSANTGSWSELGFGYDHFLSPHLMVTAGYERSAIYNLRFNQYGLPISLKQGILVNINYYPKPAFPSELRPARLVVPFISAGLEGVHWKTDREVRDELQGLYLMFRPSAGALFTLNNYTLLHLGLGIHTMLAGPAMELNGLSGQVRISYDFHRKTENELLRELEETRKTVSNLYNRADSFSVELKSEMSKLKYAVGQYEELLMGLASDVDSLETINRELSKAYQDTAARLADLKIRYTRLQVFYDSLRRHSWDSIRVVKATDTAHSLKDPKYGQTGAYIVLYTGDQLKITNQLYREISTEYPKTWLIRNPYGMHRVVIWVPEEKVEAEWKSLSVSFSGIRRIYPYK